MIRDCILVYEQQNYNKIIKKTLLINPIVLRKAKFVCNFGLSECIRVKIKFDLHTKFNFFVSFEGIVSYMDVATIFIM